MSTTGATKDDSVSISPDYKYFLFIHLGKIQATPLWLILEFRVYGAVK